jgi:hypothetical protein
MDAEPSLAADIRVQTSLFEAHQALSAADTMFADHMAGGSADGLDMELMWTVTDKYREACLLTRGSDLETEAIATSRLGKLYNAVFKLPTRGNDLCIRAVAIAHAMYPRQFTMHAWYRECVASIEAYRRANEAAMEAERAKDRAPFLDELKAELAAIEKASQKSAVDLVKHLYTTHPPKHPLHVMGSTETAVMKKTLQQAILHYHPDKQLADHGRKWFVLCEEITKTLTNKYEYFKGA